MQQEDLSKLVSDYLLLFGPPDSFDKYLAFASCIAGWQTAKINLGVKELYAKGINIKEKDFEWL